MHIASIGIDLGKTTFHLVALGERNKVSNPDVPGEFCFPPLASLITAGARLMLALLEHCVSQLGGTYVMEEHRFYGYCGDRARWLSCMLWRSFRDERVRADAKLIRGIGRCWRSWEAN